MSSQAVQLYIEKNQVVMDNGIVKVYFSNPGGFVTRIQYNGIDNLLEDLNEMKNRGYWDVVWSEAGTTGTLGTFERVVGTSYNVIMKTDEQVEISFTRIWDPSLKGKQSPLNIDKRYVMLRNSSGFYSYAIFEHLKEWPAFNIPQIRIVYKLRKDKFHYMAVGDDRQRFMPLPDDRLPGRGEELVPPEAVLLVNPVEQEFKGEVDDKYQYSSENIDLKVHGWTSSKSETNQAIGFWVIIPSNEFRSGGLAKQNLTSHVGPISLAMFLSAHYAGEDIVLKLQPNEPWKKVFGPTFVYLNTILDHHQDSLELWKDAKYQMNKEVQSWPYDFPASIDFQKSSARGSVSGTILVRDRFVSDKDIITQGAYIGLAPPGDVGSWQRECKGYQFWCRANKDGHFSIENIRSGNYNLYAWVPGFIGEYWNNIVIKIIPGCKINFGDIIFEPPRNGPTLWEIGIPDRSSAEFYIPDPNPKFINKLFIDHPDKYVMLRNSSGFYSYAIFEHLKEWPAFNIPQIRIVYKLRKDKFHYMAVGDDRQRFMPLPDDRLPGRGEELVPPEAVLLVNPVEQEFKGEVDDKYQYSSENIDLKVHGWTSSKSETNQAIGFWVIIPSNEFRSGGLAKQNLTSHVGPISLAMFLSAHYAGEDIVLKLQPNEPWKKVFGPTFVYLNTILDHPQDSLELWKDAKYQMNKEVQSWPYDFPASIDFQKSSARGSVSGTILVRDRFVSDKDIITQGAYIGLAPPGDVGSWQRECKGYQFWCRANKDGYFSIENIRSGNYNLYAWVPGFIGEYWNNIIIKIIPGCKINFGDIIFEPPRNGPTLWEIGIPDRSAAEFYIPDPNPKFINKLFIDHPDKFRQYGLWERYAELYPNEDLIYTIGVSDYTKDWFYAHVTRKKNEGIYEGTTWQIKFNLDDLEVNKIYKLRLALASANVSELQVRVNNVKQDPPIFTTGVIGKDYAIGRHGIHGLYWLFNIDIPSLLLSKGDNTIFLTQTMAFGPLARFQGIMYDYIRLEGP